VQFAIEVPRTVAHNSLETRVESIM